MNSKTDPHNFNVFSETGFFYSISEDDVDAYLRSELRKYRKATAPLVSLVCKHSKLVAYKDAGHFPQDIVSMAEKSFPKGNQQQEKYDFAVQQLETQIESLQNELTTPEVTALLARFEDDEAECLKWFNSPTVNSRSHPSPGWKTFRDLEDTFDCVQCGGIVIHFLCSVGEIQECTVHLTKRRMIKKADKQYQKTTKALRDKVPKIRVPRSSSASIKEKHNENQEFTFRGLAGFWKNLSKTICRH